MAETEFAAGAAEAVQRWVDAVIRELPREIYWAKFMAESPNAVIQVKRDLQGKPGETLTFTYSRKLTGQGVTGDSTLEGAEEALNYYSRSVTLNQFRNAVRLKGRMSERRTAFNQRTDAKEHLKTWLAEFIDDRIFTAMDASPSTVVFGGSATAITGLTAANTLSTSELDRAVARAKKRDVKIWPTRVEGGEYFVLVTHTDSAYDLRRTTTAPAWHEAMRDARERGLQNPIFTGAMGIYNQVVLHDHEKAPTASNYGAGENLAGSSSPFMGIQAALFAWGLPPEGWEKEFDYGGQIGFAIGAIFEVTKAVFNAVDHGSIAIRVTRTNT